MLNYRILARSMTFLMGISINCWGGIEGEYVGQTRSFYFIKPQLCKVHIYRDEKLNVRVAYPDRAISGAFIDDRSHSFQLHYENGIEGDETQVRQFLDLIFNFENLTEVRFQQIFLNASDTMVCKSLKKVE